MHWIKDIRCCWNFIADNISALAARWLPVAMLPETMLLLSIHIWVNLLHCHERMCHICAIAVMHWRMGALPERDCGAMRTKIKPSIAHIAVMNEFCSKHIELGWLIRTPCDNYCGSNDKCNEKWQLIEQRNLKLVLNIQRLPGCANFELPAPVTDS